MQTVDSNLYEWHVANTTTNNEDHTTRQLTLNSQQGRLLTISLETTNKEDLPALLDSLFSKTKGKDTIILSERKTSVGFLIDNIILETEPKQ